MPCLAVVQCGEQDSTKICTIQKSTNADHFSQIESTSSVPLDPDTTYHFKFALQESDKLFIVEVLPLTTEACTSKSRNISVSTVKHLLL